MLTPRAIERLPLLVYPHPALRQPAEEFSFAEDAPLLEAVVSRLAAIGYRHASAPLVGLCTAIVWIEGDVLINPQVVNASHKQQIQWVKCAALKGVERTETSPERLAVAYCDRQGKLQQRLFIKEDAAMVLHELLHLRGLGWSDLSQLSTTP